MDKKLLEQLEAAEETARKAAEKGVKVMPILRLIRIAKRHQARRVKFLDRTTRKAAKKAAAKDKD